MKAKKRPTPIITLDHIKAAARQLQKVLPVTPLSFSPYLSEVAGRELFFKWDLKFRTGSFKERGAAHFIYSLSSKEGSRGVCAASAGNHALALSYHASQRKVPCTIIMPLSAPLVKVQRTRAHGARVILQGNTFDEAYLHAQELAEAEGMHFVSAFDNTRIIAGQGTAGLEILLQLPAVDAVVVPVGGGGLISGIAVALRSLRPKTFILGVQSEWVVDARKRATKPVDPNIIRPVTIADGIAVKDMGKMTGPLVQQHVDELVQVSEAEIADAIIRFLEHERTVVEGAGAAGLAAVLAGRLPKRFTRACVMACGSNIDMNVLSRLIERDMAHHRRLLRLQASVPDRPGSLHRLTGAISRSGGNVLEVLHDRSFSEVPGNVNITMLVEVRDDAHRRAITQAIKRLGVRVTVAR